MSQRNLELVKKIIRPAGTDYADLFRDDASWEAVKGEYEPLFDRDFAGAFVAWGQRAEFSGLEDMRAAFLEWLSPWARYYDEIEQVFAVGEDRVVVLGREHGYRLDTDAEIVGEAAGVYLIRNEKIARVEYHASRAEALAAVGLGEQENFKVVQAVGDAYFRGDEAAMLDLVDPDVVVTQFADQPDARPYHGHSGMLEAMAGWVEIWEDYAIEVLAVREVGNKVLVSLHQRGRGKASGIAMEGDVYFLYTVRGGKVVRWEMFPDEREAVEAAEPPD